MRHQHPVGACHTYRIGYEGLKGEIPVIKTYQYRIYPTTKQRLTLETWLDGCQTLYNQALAMRIKASKEMGKSISYNSQARMLTELRSQSTFWNGLHIDILQDVLRRLDKAYDAFYRRLKKVKNQGFLALRAKSVIGLSPLTISQKT